MTRLPQKYTSLMKAGETVRVPDTCLITTAELQGLIADFDRKDAALAAQLTDIELTTGATLERQIARIEELLRDVQPATVWREMLAQNLDQQLESWRETPLAVRSAAAHEDDTSSSAAGLYESVIGVEGDAAVIEAIITVWKSYYARAAIVARLAANLPTQDDRMSIMVQAVIPAAAAGVAFSTNPVTRGEPICEYVAGLSGALLDGSRTGRTATPTSGPTEANDPLGSAGAQAVFADLAKLKALFDHEVDMEWVWDGQDLTVVQVRPMTALATSVEQLDAAAYYDVVPIYEDSQEAFFSSETLPDYVQYFRAKRAPLHRISQELGLWCPPALLLRVNRAGLKEVLHNGALDALLVCERVVIDASDLLRQMIVPGDKVIETLTAAQIPEGRTSCIVLRAFIKGDYGMIAQLSEDGTAVLEYSADGLMALNRGSAVSEHVILQQDGHGCPDWMSNAEARTIIAALKIATERFGPSHLEWTMHEHGLTLLDLTTRAAHQQSTPAVGGAAAVISAGFARGQVLRIADSHHLQDLSDGPSISMNEVPNSAELGPYVEQLMEKVQALPEPPILVCKRPFALLAVFLPYVAGFVFENASLLSHLSILIRESGKPGIASQSLFDSLADGQTHVLDIPSAARQQVEECTA
ncbi:PEP/pyruvate-binding domain-containing protein [Roseobacter weihaiensis]|uniref:PEP/pyruvate-binding domain-containing protein n=1 Tax=Roseobacter weihaiensis TaxID=2763262 RepID=UPI001D0ADB33|nr:PEP/pyruvate-binding domain-containing protein [Roseobacter sp. H9]